MTKVKEQFVHIDGVRIRYLTAGSGPPVLLLHGLGDSALDWQWVMPRLADRFRLIAPDLPGYSIGAGDGIVHTPANYSRLLGLFVRDLGLPSVTVVGNSMGGLVAIRLALENPGLVPALALVASAGLGKAINPLVIPTTLPSGDLAVAASATWYGARVRSGLRSLILFANPWRAPREWFEEQHRLIGIPSFRTAILAMSRNVLDFSGQREVVADELPEMNLPILILWGKFDRMVPVSQGLKVGRLLKQGKIFTFPDCGHVPHIENPPRFAEVLGDFLEPRLLPQNHLHPFEVAP